MSEESKQLKLLKRIEDFQKNLTRLFLVSEQIGDLIRAEAIKSRDELKNNPKLVLVQSVKPGRKNRG